MSKNQLGDTMEVYIDDMWMKSKQENEYIQHVKCSTSSESPVWNITLLSVRLELLQVHF